MPGHCCSGCKTGDGCEAKKRPGHGTPVVPGNAFETHGFDANQSASLFGAPITYVAGSSNGSVRAEATRDADGYSRAQLDGDNSFEQWLKYIIDKTGQRTINFFCNWVGQSAIFYVAHPALSLQLLPYLALVTTLVCYKLFPTTMDVIPFTNLGLGVGVLFASVFFARSHWAYWLLVAGGTALGAAGDYLYWRDEIESTMPLGGLSPAVGGGGVIPPIVPGN
jgi:hypothetical protein